jgi:hypothetical protein
MPPDPVTTQAEALAGMYIISDNGLKRSSAKLRQGVGPGDPEGFYMLAAYCFDLARRFYYLTELTAPFRASASDEFRGRVSRENDYIQGGDGDSWESRAKRAEELLLRYAGSEAAREHDAFMRGEGSVTAP